jgi:hypothetical protein
MLAVEPAGSAATAAPVAPLQVQQIQEVERVAHRVPSGVVVRYLLPLQAKRKPGGVRSLEPSTACWLGSR